MAYSALTLLKNLCQWGFGVVKCYLAFYPS